MSIGRQEAFEIFTRDCEDTSKIEEQKKILKKHYNEAKALGEAVNQARNKTSKKRILYSFS
jgi:kinesin family member 6/9